MSKLSDEPDWVESLQIVWAILLDWIKYLWDELSRMFGFDTPGRPKLDPIKKDDDLLPKHFHAVTVPRADIASSEADFLAHFLPAPGNHPAMHSSSSLRQLPSYHSSNRLSHQTLLNPHRQCAGQPAPPVPPPMFNQFSPYRPAPLPALSSVQLHSGMPGQQQQAGLYLPAGTTHPGAPHEFPILQPQPTAAGAPQWEQVPQPAAQAPGLYGSSPCAPGAASAAPVAPAFPMAAIPEGAGAAGPQLGVQSAAQYAWQASAAAAVEASGAARQVGGSPEAIEGASPRAQRPEHVGPSAGQSARRVTWGAPLATVSHQHETTGASASLHDRSRPAGPMESRDPSGGPMTASVAPNIINFDELIFGTLVGEGGFGKVYYGEYNGEEVAIKVLASEASVRGNVVDEFRREITTMTTLPGHPNVLRLLGACIAPPNLAIVTQYCERGSLYAMLHSPSLQLSWSQITYICLGAARGMAHLHSCHVLHRDLKSGNLLVDTSFTVKVADFGLSRMVGGATMTGGLGTYQWMAPEVLAHQRYSEKADVYSFSIVLWECTARQVPYAGLNGMHAAMAVMNRGLRPTVPTHTPSPLADLIRACWAPIPDQRPSFLQIVERLLAMYDEVQTFRWEP